MFRTLDDFSAAWTQETESTLKILRTLTDASLAQRVTPDGRTLGFLAWHITCTLAEMGGHAALAIDGPTEQTPEAVPKRAAEIAAQYERAAAQVVPAVRAKWTDAMLSEKVPMYGEDWPRGLTLAILISHQTHHRGQMTVLMRQAGLPVPGMVGPSKEEWAAMGMPAQP
ncbi:MAG: DinB family protein [Gemmatimonadetes bacterium]|nr:DinB family protein [Gemmatimonadota bacterium]